MHCPRTPAGLEKLSQCAFQSWEDYCNRQEILMSSSTNRFDIILYGASGFTGQYVLESFANSEEFGKVSIAVAGRNEQKLDKTLKLVSELTGKNLRDVPIVIADTCNENQLNEMARQAKIIVNVVGPYRLHGEAVVKASVENGANHLDISGEPAWLETMQMKYSEQAKEKGIFIIGACGWDSIPCDMGMNFLKKNFPGTLSYAETFARIKMGKSGYSFNSGTYQTLVLGIWQAKNDGLGKIRREIMPERLERAKWKPKKRSILWWNEVLECYCLPFMGADKSIVQRSNYFDAVVNKSYPAAIETYICVRSWFWAIALMVWLSLFNIAVKFDFTRVILQKYPGICSGFLFKEDGPTREQAKQASFEYWFFGYGWEGDSPSMDDPPQKEMVIRCDGPDAGYIATAGCLLSCAFTLLKERENMPKQAGALTTAAAFKNTNLYDRLASFGITFRIDPTKLSK